MNAAAAMIAVAMAAPFAPTVALGGTISVFTGHSITEAAAATTWLSSTGVLVQRTANPVQAIHAPKRVDGRDRIGRVTALMNCRACGHAHTTMVVEQAHKSAQ